MPGRTSLRAACVVLAAAFAALYAATWSGHYPHDGAILAESFEAGGRRYPHLAYFPAAAALDSILRLLGSTRGETALAALSVVSGAAAVGLSGFLAAKAFGRAGPALAAAAIAGLAPAAWLQSCVVSVHSFSALGASLGALVAFACPGGPALAVPLATLLAASFHLSSVLLAPGFLAISLLALRRAGRAPRRLEVVLAVLFTALAIAAWRAVLGLLLGGRWAEGENSVASWLVAAARGTPGSATFLARRLWEEGIVPWGLVPLALPALLALRGGRLSLPAWLALAGSLPAVWLVLVAPPLLGQYTLILFPLAVLLGSRALGAVGARPGLVLAAALLAQAAVAVPVRLRMNRDPDVAWAEALARDARPPAFVVCGTHARARLARSRAGVEAWKFVAGSGPALEGTLEAIRAELQRRIDRGERVYLDAGLFDPDRPARGAAELLARRLAFAEEPSAGTRRVIGIVRD